MSNAGLLHKASREGDLAVIGQCLSAGIDVNAKDKHKRTALHLAAWAGQTEAVRALVSAAGVRVKEPAVDNMTALHFAAQNGHAEVCRMLITAGVPVNIKNKKGVTALHFACSKGHSDAVSLLLKRKAGPFIADKKGENALDKCTENTTRAIVQQAMDAETAADPFKKKRKGAPAGDAVHKGSLRASGATIGHAANVQDDEEDDDDYPILRPKKKAAGPDKTVHATTAPGRPPAADAKAAKASAGQSAEAMPDPISAAGRGTEGVSRATVAPAQASLAEAGAVGSADAADNAPSAATDSTGAASRIQPAEGGGVQDMGPDAAGGAEGQSGHGPDAEAAVTAAGAGLRDRTGGSAAAPAVARGPAAVARGPGANAVRPPVARGPGR
eukprot:jgi/Ulvmu1/2544/UM139_0012.1